MENLISVSYTHLDYTRTAYNLIRKHGYPHEFYYVNFMDMNRTYRLDVYKRQVEYIHNVIENLKNAITNSKYTNYIVINRDILKMCIRDRCSRDKSCPKGFERY